MKKNMIFAFSLLAAAVSFGSSVESDNTFGILKIAVPVGESIIAVPWVAVGGGNVTASDLVLTTNLNDGDKLAYYDPESKKYKVWSISSGAWTEPIIVTGIGESETSGSVKATTIPRGGAWFFVTETAKDIYLYGQYSADTVTTTISRPTTGTRTQAWNLIAPPTAESYNLNSATWTNVGTKDYIVIGFGSANRFYYRSTELGYKWGYYTTNDNGVDVFHEGATIPQGRGAWYVAVGTGSETSCQW